MGTLKPNGKPDTLLFKVMVLLYHTPYHTYMVPTHTERLLWYLLSTIPERT